MKFPIVSSTTIRKSCLSARERSFVRSTERRSGFDGKSVNIARMGGFEGMVVVDEGVDEGEVDGEREERRVSREATSESRPVPKKYAPRPHFSRILSVSVYGNLYNKKSAFTSKHKEEERELTQNKHSSPKV